jgi:tetratricopeptide (TPR) repeat protein
MWCGFDLLPPEQLSQMIRDMDKSISALEDQLKKAEEESVPYDTFYDDLCLAYFFKGLAQRELGLPTHKTQIPCTEFATQPLESSQESRLLESIKTFQKVVENGDDIELDHWMVPFARFEIGQTQMRLKNYSQARKEFKAAMKGGFLDKEQGIKRLRVSMEANLHLRAHNCAVKTDVLERIARLHGGSRPVENDQEDDNDQEEKASEEEEDDWAN